MPRRGDRAASGFSTTNLLAGCFGTALTVAVLASVRFSSSTSTPSNLLGRSSLQGQDTAALGAGSLQSTPLDVAEGGGELPMPTEKPPHVQRPLVEQQDSSSPSESSSIAAASGCALELHPEEAIGLLSTAAFPTKLGRCAMVGSAASLQGQARGPEIDAHDTVVRMNRLPPPELHRDMGQRTDIYFKNLLSDFTHNRTRVWYMEAPSKQRKGKSNNPPGGWCQHRHPSKKGCEFGAILYEGASKEQQRKLKWLSPRPEMSLPYARQSDLLHVAEHSFALFGDGKKVPSAGFKAFLTCAVLCNSISLYGFAGTSTLDGHFLAHTRHDLEMEHAVLERLAAGEIRDADFAHRKVLEHGKPDAAFVAKLKRRLGCLGMAGRISLPK